MRFPSIHIAGSKGKGSTAAYTAALIASGNRRVGIYTSPHLLDYRERFRLYGEDFPEEAALSSARDLLTALPDLEAALPGEGGATTFELLTLFRFSVLPPGRLRLHGTGNRAGRPAGCHQRGRHARSGDHHSNRKGTHRYPGPTAFRHRRRKSRYHETRDPGILRRSERTGPAGSPSPGEGTGMPAPLPSRPARSADQTGAASAERSEISASSPSGDRAPETPVWKWNLSWRSAPPEEMRLSIGGKVQAENAALAISAVRHLYPGTGEFGSQ